MDRIQSRVYSKINDGYIRVAPSFPFSIKFFTIIVLVQFEWFHTSVKFSDGDLLSISPFLSLTVPRSHYDV